MDRGTALRGRFASGGVLLAVCLVLAGCSKPAPPPSPAPETDVLARVGDRAIRAADLKAEVDWRIKSRRPVPDKEALLQEMIQRETLLQRARATGIEHDPEARREVENLLIGKLWERDVQPRLDAVDVTFEEVEAEYRKNLPRYTRPPMVRLALLHLQGSPGMTDARRAELRARMEEARTKAVAAFQAGTPATAGFGPLARAYSDDQTSRYRGGDIGWHQSEDATLWPREVLAAGFALEPGKVSEIIESGAGLYLVLKSDSRPAQVTPLDKVQAALRQSLLVQKRQAVEAEFRRAALDALPATVNDEALAAVALPQLQTARATNAEPPALPGGASEEN